ncbi:hypothetical protein BOX15_Mlig002224g1 [Macrostomum lignano]|uniref:Uncharacterized protein n=1 Tax=Macrostomum lignano TaxID=282301 RepID=A0A267G7M2_9PLAT|nr:hypothetical protein BOX15_Mlig002224g1 [Macrostomum lignano]
MADSSARMEVFECPICAPKRYFVTEIGLRTHVADRHPWRSLPPAQRRLTPTRAAMPEPTWLRERQAAAAESVYHQQQAPSSLHHSQLPQQLHLRHPQTNGAPSMPGNNHQQHHRHHHNSNALVTFDTQSQLSDDVFFEEAGGGGGGRNRGFGQPPQQQQQQRRHQQHLQQSGYDEYPPPDYDLTPFELTRSLDAVDSSARKRRDLATTRRPWYDSEDYTGPRNLMEKRPGGYFDDQNEMEAGLDDGQGSYPRGNGGAYSGRRMRHEIEERDSRIETLRMEIDRLWDERMRLLKHEAEGIRAVKDQGGAGLPYEGRRNQRGFMDDNGGQFGQGHAFQPVLPHSRMQLYRQQPPQPQPQPKQHHYMGMRRPADY